MKNKTTVSANNQVATIQEKIQLSGSHWSHIKIAQPSQNGYNFEFHTILLDESEYAIYERQGQYFVLIDFFKNYEEANDLAKKIINNHSQLKQIFNIE